MTDPYDLDDDGLKELLAGEPAYRARQVRGWLARGVDDPGRMTDLPKAVRDHLVAHLEPPPEIVRRSVSDGGLTHKVLLRYSGDEFVEAVLMLYPRTPQRSHARATVCVSTQAGCAMGCPFCATGQAGFRRQLRFGEVVRQVALLQRMLQDGTIEVHGAPDHVTNVVFMGMGEPLANADATVAAVRWLADPERGLGLSARSITVSTVGLVPGIRRLASLGLPITLAVSLHAPTDELRCDLVPINRQFPIAALLEACRDWQDVTGRRLTYEYVLIGGVNDRLEHAGQLAELLTRPDTPRATHVNLIPMNPTPGVPWQAPPVAAQRGFAAVLDRAGLPVTVRRNRGGDIDAACGQLYADYAVASGQMMAGARDAWRRLGALPVAGSGGGA